MGTRILNWLLGRKNTWSHLHSTRMRDLSVLLAAVFLLFTVPGFYSDLMSAGRMPWIHAAILAAISGVNGVLWVLGVARMPGIFMVGLFLGQFLIGAVNRFFIGLADHLWHPPAMAQEPGLAFVSTATLVCVILSYTLFARFMAVTGQEAMRIRNELELAQGIQKTLVPPVSRVTAHFEIYGISHPSDKVGGDLVDVVELPGGDCVAYLADIAGHGLQAGILMGMLKTAARTALTNGLESPSETILASLMERLNLVLPQVKEPHMYATFTALRLNGDGRAFYGMAASPPLLHWRAEERRMQPIEEEQFPLGLLPVSGFAAHPLEMQAGDIAVIATDGILEVNAKKQRGKGAEFGAQSLGDLIGANATLPLEALAGQILASVRSFGEQFDDQTLLMVRRVC